MAVITVTGMITSMATTIVVAARMTTTMGMTTTIATTIVVVAVMTTTTSMAMTTSMDAVGTITNRCMKESSLESLRLRTR